MLLPGVHPSGCFTAPTSGSVATNTPMTDSLTSGQRRKLKSLAQRLDATVTLGKAGVSAPFLASLQFELDRHELVKVKFADCKDERHELAPQLAEKTASQLVCVIGHVAVFFRQQPDPAKRKIAV